MTLAALQQRMSEALKRAAFTAEDHFFERAYGCDFGGIIPPENLFTNKPSSLDHATAYHAVWCRNVRVLMAHARAKSKQFDYFVDVGSGKGKACLYAYTKRAFSKVIGVEFSLYLLRVAEENRRKIGADSVAFVHADASDYLLPDDGRCFVFLFNPFDAHVLDRFLNNNMSHFERHGSVLAYANDIERATLAKHGFLTEYRDDRRAISLHRLP